MRWFAVRDIVFKQGKAACMDSKAKEIRDFDENLAAIIEKAIGNVEEVAAGILAEAGVEVLQV